MEKFQKSNSGQFLVIGRELISNNPIQVLASSIGRQTINGPIIVHQDDGSTLKIRSDGYLIKKL